MEELQLTLSESGEDFLLKEMPFIEVFRAFSLVVESSFGSTLGEGVIDHIQNFKNSYEALGISVTPKVK